MCDFPKKKKQPPSTLAYFGEGATQFDMRCGGKLPAWAHGERPGVQAVEVGHNQKEVRGGLHWQETTAWNIHAHRSLKALDGCAHRCLQLQDI